MVWRSDFERRIISSQDAAKLVMSGARVHLPQGSSEPKNFGMALAARRGELSNVELVIPTPRRDFPWYEPGWEDTFKLSVGYLLPRWRGRLQGRVDHLIGSIAWRMKAQEERPSEAKQTDLYITEVSPPDKHGFCSFGPARWDKKERLRAAKVALGQLNSSLIRTYGDNFIHYSEIDHFIEDVARPPREPEPPEIPESVRTIAGYVRDILRDGDTIQVGAGRTSEAMPIAGALEGKNDLGIHTEFVAYGLIGLVRQGVITGRRKTINTGKVVAASCWGTAEDMEFVHENPVFELYGPPYTMDIRTIAAQDNMATINSALAVDLTGEIAAESIGPQMYSGAGGQLAFVIGALLSRGGRAITVLPAASSDGRLSRIVPMFEQGTVVTIPRTCVDYVVTEYGVARLYDKTQRERAHELIAIAHPDFRDELRLAARKLYG
ncbi:MAG: 4-hydroxybutyrate CoA transferase [Chloroflexi bacterium]|nr:4-hydroxybutyrate CoA transferase [Chloroflexota bacterium]